MSKYTFKDTTHSELLTYLKTRPFNEVGELISLVEGEATQEYNQDDVIKVVTYVINRPYYEVFQIANKLVSQKAEEPAPEKTEDLKA